MPLMRRARPARRAVRWAGLPLAAVLVVAVPMAGLAVGITASGAPDPPVTVPQYSATVTVNQDGTLHVGEAVTYDFGGRATSELDRVITTREHYDAEDDLVYDLTDVSVGSVQTDLDATVTSDDESDTIAVDFAEPQARQVTVTYDYDVSGAVRETPDGLEVRWPVVQGLAAPVGQANVTWNALGVNWLSCLAGAPGSSMPCTTAQLGEVASPTMTQTDLAAGEQLVGILGLGPESGVAPNTDLQARWSIGRAFTATGTPLWVALGVLALGLLAALGLWLVRGRDQEHAGSGGGSPVAEVDGQPVFAPPSAVRPGQMGTLVDERADIVDVSSTIVDLAVRNYLFIEELPHGDYGRHDWLLRKRNQPGDELLAYERELFDGMFAERDEVLVTELDGSLRERLPVVQSSLYDDMVRQGWFGERPDAVRGRWTTAGLVLVAAGVVLTVVLSLVSTFGLVGLAVILGGVALTASGQAAPARTARGSRTLGQLRDFRSYLEAVDLTALPFAQRQVLISRCYPYALVFGLGERWANALAATDPDDTPDEPIAWYGAPTNWHLSDIAPSLAHLSAALNAAVAPRRLLND